VIVSRGTVDEGAAAPFFAPLFAHFYADPHAWSAQVAVFHVEQFAKFSA
jgi:hypothetical protein